MKQGREDGRMFQKKTIHRLNISGKADVVQTKIHVFRVVFYMFVIRALMRLISKKSNIFQYLYIRKNAHEYLKGNASISSTVFRYI